jgi:hypothetical protein
MRKFLCVFIILVGVVGLSIAAQSFTTLNTSQYWGKTAMPKLTEALDANFGALTSTDDVQFKSVTLENGEKIANGTDAKVTTTFDDDAVVLGTEQTDTTNVATNMADGDEFRKDYVALNDATQSVTYARVIVDLDDISDTTEDASYEVWVEVNGTLTQIATVSATGLAVVGDVGGTTATMTGKIDSAADVEGATLSIEDGSADGYFERSGTALNWVEGGVTNVIDADVGS